MLAGLVLVIFNARAHRDSATALPASSAAPPQYASVTVYDPASRPLLPWWSILAPLLSVSAVLAWHAWRTRAGAPMRPWAALLLVGVALPLTLADARRVTRLHSYWTIADRLALPTGAAMYHLLHRAGPLRQELVLATLRASAGPRFDFTPLGTAQVVTPGGAYVAMLRPAPAASVAPHPYALRSAPDGTLLGFGQRENFCYWAYVPARGEFMAGEAVRAVSPFSLLEAAAPIDPDDLAYFEKLLAAQAARGDQEIVTGLPTRETLEAAATHPNPAARNLARKALGILPEPRTLAAR